MAQIVTSLNGGDNGCCWFEADIRQNSDVRLVPIVLKNSEIAVLRKSRKCRMLAISATARLCRIDTDASGCFAAIDVVPHVAASETHQRASEFSVISEK